MPEQQHSNYMANCGLFWITNSIMSATMGMNNRQLQEEAHKRNEAFQSELEQAKTLTQVQLEAEKIAYKRRLMKLSRQYRLKECVDSFDQQLRSVELQSFISNRYWPLHQSLPYTLITYIQQSMAKGGQMPLNIILLHAPLLPTRLALAGEFANKEDKLLYAEIEETIATEDIPLIEDVKFRRDSCDSTDFVGGNTNMMNIHFLMSPIPTLVISPHYHEGKMYFNSAVWEAQAARPLIRPLFSIDYELYIEKDDDMRQHVVDVFRTAITSIIGTTRDSFMLMTQGKSPTFPKLLQTNEKFRMMLHAEDGLHQFVRKEYQNMLGALDASQTPHLLDFFDEVDISNLRKKISNSRLL